MLHIAHALQQRAKRQQLLSIVFITVTAITIFFSIASSVNHLVHASDPELIPEACLTFTVATGTITDFRHTQTGCEMRDTIIPSTIGGVEVKAVGSSAFADSQLTSVTIPNSVTSIGDTAFVGNPLEVIYLQGEATLGANALGSPGADAEANFLVCVTSMGPPPSDLSEYIPCYNQVYTSESYLYAYLYSVS